MNSTLDYLICKVETDYCHFLLTLDTGNEKIRLLFSNAPGFDKREECIGTELQIFNGTYNLFYNKKSDLSEYGRYRLKSAGKYKIIFSIESGFLKGNYVLLRPSWAKSNSKNIWTLIPSKTMK